VCRRFLPAQADVVPARAGSAPINRFVRETGSSSSTGYVTPSWRVPRSSSADIQTHSSAIAREDAAMPRSAVVCAVCHRSPTRGGHNHAGDVFICAECQAGATQFIEIQDSIWGARAQPAIHGRPTSRHTPDLPALFAVLRWCSLAVMALTAPGRPPRSLRASRDQSIGTRQTVLTS
jgi:hypothetical protein